MTRGPVKATLTSPSEILRKKLVALEATKDGFEGLITELVSAATMGQMRLMSSGDQQGVDALSDPSSTAPRRAMQAKRYGPKTPFNLNTLLGEMVRAEKAFPDIDVWVMASTKAVHGKESDQLVQHALSLGWSFIALDWSKASGLPRLAALCAAYPQATLAAMPGADTEDVLNKITSDPAFDNVKSAVLNDLRSEDADFRAAAKHSHARLNDMYTDPSLARTVAGPSPAFLAEAPPVLRPKLDVLLQNWWSSDKRAVALLGDEGMGKTWEGLQFMRMLGGADPAPLVVVVKSKTAESTKDGEQAIVEALVKMFSSSYTKVTNPELFWQRRLRRWTKSESKLVRLLVLIDGLDELDPFAWEDWLAPFMVKEAGSLFRLILACRTDDWRNRIAVAQNFGQFIHTVPIAKFEKSERDAYLTARGIDIAPLSPKVLEAALHPRTAFHLTRMAKDLPDLTRVTREQLLLRDFQNRWAVKGGNVAAKDFRKLVQNMAKLAQDAALHQKAFSISKGAVLDEVADITGYDKSKMRSVLSDLLSSDWCTRSAEDPTKLEFRDRSLPDAVGMALASEIASKPVEAAEDHLDRFLEPWGADDILEPILRTCATALLIDPKVYDAVCFMILERWYRVPFHNDAGQDFWRRLHIFRPTLMLDFAEKNSQRHFNWLIEWGIACLWDDHPSTRPQVEDRLQRWLVRAALADYQHYPDSAAEKVLNRDYRWCLSRVAVLERKGLGRSTATLSASTKAKDSYLPSQAVRTMSFLPLVPLLPLIREWALAVAATAYVEPEDKLAALVRYNTRDHDGFLKALRGCAASLPGMVSLGVGRRAAATLLRLTGIESDALRSEKIFKPFRRVSNSLLNVSTEEIDVTHEGLTQPKYLLSALAQFAVDPSRRLSPALRTALIPIVVAAIVRPGFLGENGDTKIAVLRWFQNELRLSVAGQLLSDPPLGEGDVEKREMLRKIAVLTMPGLEDKERLTVGDNLVKSVETNGNGWPIALAYRLSALPFSEQIALILSTPLAHLPNDLGSLIKVPAGADIEAIANAIDPTGEEDAIFLRLHLLYEIAQRHKIEAAKLSVDWARLFQRTETRTVHAAMAVASALDQERAASALREIGWSASDAADDLERFWGSNILTCSADADVPALLPKMSSDSLLYMYDGRADLRTILSSSILARFRDVLLTPRTSYSFGGRSIKYNGEDQFYASFYADHADAINGMLKDAWSDPKTRHNVSYGYGTGAAWKLLRLAADRNPDFVAEVWAGSLEDNRHSHIGDIEIFPATLGATPQAEEMRRTMLRRASTDAYLFSACVSLQHHGHQEIVISELKKCWLTDKAIEKARALAIAGFLTESAESTVLWGTLKRPKAGWLCEIYDKACANFQAGLHSRHWARVLSQSEDTAEIWSAYHLLLQTVDDRVYIKPRALDVPPKSWKESWLDFLHDQRGDARKKNQDRWKDSQLLSEKVSEVVYLE